MTKTWFETVKLPQLFIEPRFRVEVDERVEGGVEVEVNVQNEMVNLQQSCKEIFAFSTKPQQFAPGLAPFGLLYHSLTLTPSSQPPALSEHCTILNTN